MMTAVRKCKRPMGMGEFPATVVRCFGDKNHSFLLIDSGSQGGCCGNSTAWNVKPWIGYLALVYYDERQVVFNKLNCFYH